MNAIVKNLDVPTEAGTPFGGGFYAGRIAFNGDIYATIVSPKNGGEHGPVVWLPNYTEIAGAGSFFDGLANTKAMADAGSDLAKWALALNLGGETDWYLPSRDELELLYRHFKPTDDENYVYRNGDNPTSCPSSRRRRTMSAATTISTAAAGHCTSPTRSTARAR